MIRNSKIFQAGGWVREGDSLYIERQADQKLVEYIERGERLICLAEPHQSGKTSLLHKTCDELQARGDLLAAYIDLQNIITHGALEMQSYFSIAKKINKVFGLSNDEIKKLREKHEGQNPKAFCLNFIKSLSRLKKKIVIFIDELGFIPLYDLAFDGFFSSISEAENVTFVLAGVFSTKLIGKKSPAFFDAEKKFLPIYDFTRPEMKEFDQLFDQFPNIDSQRVIDDIYKWTSGQPYMSQKIGETITASFLESSLPPNSTTVNVDKIVENLFLKDYIYSDNSLASANANFNLFLEDPVRCETALKIYENLLNTENALPKADLLNEFSTDSQEAEYILDDLCVCGLTDIDENSNVKIKNKIFRTVFNEKWIKLQREDEDKTAATTASFTPNE